MEKCNFLIYIYLYSNVLSSVFGPVSAVEHASEERKAHRVDVRTLQHSCILPLQISGAVCVSFRLNLDTKKNTLSTVQLLQ